MGTKRDAWIIKQPEGLRTYRTEDRGVNLGATHPFMVYQRIQGLPYSECTLRA